MAAMGRFVMGDAEPLDVEPVLAAVPAVMVRLCTGRPALLAALTNQLPRFDGLGDSLACPYPFRVTLLLTKLVAVGRA